LRSWSLVKMGTSANQKKVFFNLRKAQSKISVFNDGDMRPDQVKIIARRIGVTETDVIYMNRRLGGDASLNVAIREDGDSGEGQGWLGDAPPALGEVGGRGGKTTPGTGRRPPPGERIKIPAARRCPMRSPCSTSASGASSR